MKKFFASVLFFTVCVMLHAQDAVRFEFSDGIGDVTLKSKMEQQISALLTAINRAETNRSSINLGGIDIDERTSHRISTLWNAVHFRIVDDDIVEHCHHVKNSSGIVVGYQVRNIAVEIRPLDNTYNGVRNQEVSINLDLKGTVTDINFTRWFDFYMAIIKKGECLNDLERREQVLHWVEQFRNAYTRKDIVFMENVLSGDTYVATDENISMGKQQCLAYLRKVFSENSYFNIRFDDISVTRLTSMPNCYGVTLRQEWTSPNKNEEGVVYFIWDFSSVGSPKILFLFFSSAIHVEALAQDDRAAFGLKGNVKKVIQHADVDVIVYYFGTEWIACDLEFSRSGKLLRVNGLKGGNTIKDMEGEYFAADYEEFKEATKDVPAGVFVFTPNPEFGVIRDVNGRIWKRVHLVTGCEDDWEEWETLQYDDQGRVASMKMVVKNSYEEKFTDRGDNIKYFYDENGNVVKAVRYDSNEKKTYTMTYTYKEFDAAGNWLVRVANCAGSGPRNEIERRKVEYW